MEIILIKHQSKLQLCKLLFSILREAFSNTMSRANIPLEGRHGREKRSSLSENLII